MSLLTGYLENKPYLQCDYIPLAHKIILTNNRLVEYPNIGNIFYNDKILYVIYKFIDNDMIECYKNGNIYITHKKYLYNIV